MNRSGKIAITGMGVVSPIGSSITNISAAFRAQSPQFSAEIGSSPVSRLGSILERELSELKKSNHPSLDRVVLLALLAASKLNASCSLQGAQDSLLVNIGSSRGATETLEASISQFKRGERISSRTSPSTTLGLIASSVAQLFGENVFPFSHSMTCSGTLVSLGNALAWIRSGMVKRAIVGGSEAPLTDFTVEQMKRLGIYSQAAGDQPFACRPLEHGADQDTFVLGEGSALFLLESLDGHLCGEPLGVIDSYGYGYESLKSQTSLKGDSIGAAMKAALDSRDSSLPIDAIVTHATGTVQGDSAELRAIYSLFGEELPMLVSNKWLIGHTMGASGGMNLVTALAMFAEPSEIFDFPYQTGLQQYPREIRTVMVNSAGFGGVANSVVVSHPHIRT